jgi:hypothetical protein
MALAEAVKARSDAYDTVLLDLLAPGPEEDDDLVTGIDRLHRGHRHW